MKRFKLNRYKVITMQQWHFGKASVGEWKIVLLLTSQNNAHLAIQKRLFMKKICFIFLAILLTTACGTSTEKHSGSEKAESAAINPEAVQTIHITVTGMTCGGCERTVQAAVTQLPGVLEAEASHTDSVAIVTFDTTLVSFAQMQEAINAKGYQAKDFVIVEKEDN